MRIRPIISGPLLGAPIPWDLNSTYDGTGNVQTLNSETYGYDWLNRLTSASGPWGTTTYSYDGVGNMAKKVDGGTTTTYTYGSFNRLTSDGTNTYTYDADGNLATKTGGYAYSYDYENRLTVVNKSGTTLQRNYYNGDGQRVKSVAGSTTLVYAYQGLSDVYEKNTGSGAVNKYFYANGLLIAQGCECGGYTYYYHEDALGSVRMIDEGQSPTYTLFTSDYRPFGSNYDQVGASRFEFTGKRRDEATGLYYSGARFYDSSIGRFITEDTYAGRKSDPMSFNRYIYARDNPMRFIDPSGHAYVCEEGYCFTANSAGAAAAMIRYPSAQSNQVVSTSTTAATTSTSSTSATTATTATTASTSNNVVQSRCALDPDECLRANGSNQPAAATDPQSGTSTRTPVGTVVGSVVALSVTEVALKTLLTNPLLQIADSLASAAVVYGNVGYALWHGQCSLKCALAFGFETGGLAATFLGVPEVGLPVMTVTAWWMGSG